MLLAYSIVRYIITIDYPHKLVGIVEDATPRSVTKECLLKYHS